MNKRNLLIITAIVTLTAAPAFASGFAFYEQGAKASALGGAWVASADDAAANWYNPAALVHLSGREIQFGINYLDMGRDTQFSPAAGVSYDAVGNVSTPVHFYFSQKINDRVAWGVGFNNPFGLVTEWQDTPIVYSSRRAELRTFLLNPNIAFKLGQRWSFAIGADYLAADVRDFSRDLTPPNPPNTTTSLDGEGTAWGYNLALQFKMESFSLAGSYRSAIEPTIRGYLSLNGTQISPATADLSLPGQTMLGAAWTGKRVDIEVGGYYTQWNYFKTLTVDTGNDATSASQTENWTGTWSYRLGIAVRLGSEMKHELRLGGVFDETPIPVEYLRPSIPDADRTGYTLGYGYLSEKWGIDVYAMQIDFDDVTADGSPADGVINGTYTSSVLLAGVSAKYRF